MHKPTIKDVAARSGMSIGTVSRVLNGSQATSEASRLAVLEAARELGYLPNAHARSLRSAHSGTIALLVPDIRNPFFAELARETGAWILGGTLHVLLDDGRAANRSYLFDAGGRVVASYDKIHMFDVTLKDGESYRESATFRPGERAVVAASPWGGIGMTVCYDVRFAYLYRALAQAGASILTVPAAFTVPTGRAHWHTLLRARAIETGCFVVAPAQTGSHDQGRQTYGHSLLIAPWGEVLADAGTDVGFITADLDLDRVAEARGMVPSLTHDRDVALERIGF